MKTVEENDAKFHFETKYIFLNNFENLKLWKHNIYLHKMAFSFSS